LELLPSHTPFGVTARSVFLFLFFFLVLNLDKAARVGAVRIDLTCPTESFLGGSKRFLTRLGALVVIVIVVKARFLNPLALTA
jgi:hypothetical protein